MLFDTEHANEPQKPINSVDQLININDTEAGHIFDVTGT